MHRSYLRSTLLQIAGWVLAMLLFMIGRYMGLADDPNARPPASGRDWRGLNCAWACVPCGVLG